MKARDITHLLSGLIFGLGLALAGMTQPKKVVGFLDFFGDWDPALAFVMGGAVAVNMIFFRLTLRRSRPLFGPVFGLPRRTDLDARLLTGAGLFGLGWGLAGFCPGPALTSLPAGTGTVLTFVGAMAAGMWLFRLYEQLRQPASAPAIPRT